MDGGGGNDHIEQQTLSGDADVLGGGADNDFIWSQGAGTTEFDGGPGDDLLVQSVFTSGVPVVMSGGEGEDDATLGNGFGEGIAVSLDDQANDGRADGRHVERAQRHREHQHGLRTRRHRRLAGPEHHSVRHNQVQRLPE